MDFNLVGGEPTLNLNVLEMTLRMVSQFSDRDIQMTSNGWWLRTPESFGNVMDILGPYLESDRLHLRISSSPFHDVYRSEKEVNRLLHGYRLASDIVNCFEDLREKAFKSYVARNPTECPACDKSLTPDDWDCYECPHCEEDLLDHRYAYEDRIPAIQRIYKGAAALEAADGNFYVDRQDSRGLSNTGRAAINQMATRGGDCGWAESTLKWTFKPGARVHDFCCSGGPSEGGHATEGLKLLLRRTLLLQDLHDEFPEQRIVMKDDNSFSRCEACPTRSRQHFAMGSVYYKLIEKAYPILVRKLNKLAA